MSDGAPFEKAICKSSIENGCISYLYAIIYFQEREFTNKGKRGKRIWKSMGLLSLSHNLKLFRNMYYNKNILYLRCSSYYEIYNVSSYQSEGNVGRIFQGRSFT